MDSTDAQGEAGRGFDDMGDSGRQAGESTWSNITPRAKLPVLEHAITNGKAICFSYNPFDNKNQSFSKNGNTSKSERV